jgi:hypothetical protein
MAHRLTGLTDNGARRRRFCELRLDGFDIPLELPPLRLRYRGFQECVLELPECGLGGPGLEVANADAAKVLP